MAVTKSYTTELVLIDGTLYLTYKGDILPMQMITCLDQSKPKGSTHTVTVQFLCEFAEKAHPLYLKDENEKD